jgi:ABC-type glycerol-3-phosphate transport system permease component
LTLNVNGKSVAFAYGSQGDVWVISCIYAQSQQAFTIQIPLEQIISPAATPWVAIIAAIAVLIALLAIVVVIRRRRKTASTVASILKQNRPVY